jgi:hypothetical protein
MSDTSRSVSSNPAEASAEIDMLLADLDLVLRCRCCLPRGGFLAEEIGSSAEAPAEDSFSREVWSDVAYRGESR